MTQSSADANNGSEVDPENARILSLSGSPNFRDAGGYSCAGGTLRWGQLFRSGHLAKLSAEEQRQVESLGLELIVDLRRPDERDSEPTPLPETIARIHANITPGSQGSAIYSDSTQLGGPEAMFRFMCDINREFVESQTATFADIFEQLLDSGARRVLVHCSAGKDRTGFMVAMIQLLLGVDVDDVRDDYMLSRRYYLPQDHLPRVREKYAVGHLSDEDLLPMMQTEVDYLNSALDAIESGFGTVDQYLMEGLKLGESERREFRRRFVDTGGT
ncbi:MAG: tyrosine-protein phosphatase [Pseudomonadota bacterium]